MKEKTRKNFQKITGSFFGATTVFCFLNSLFLTISNIQATRNPDGFPLDSWWLITGFALLGCLFGITTIAIWPQKKQRQLKICLPNS
jgi:hypothetical protein